MEQVSPPVGNRVRWFGFGRLSNYPARPSAIILLWLAAIALRFGTALISLQAVSGVATITFRIIGTTIFAALIAAAILGLRANTLRLLHAFASIDLLGALVQLALAYLAGPGHEELIFVLLFAPLAMCAFVWQEFRARVSPKRLGLALFAIAATSALPFASDRLDRAYYGLLSRIHEPPAAYEPPYDYADELWESQGRLIDEAFDRLRPAATDARTLHMLGVAPDGSQNLFSREARTALRIFAARHGPNARGGILLSNAAPDIMKLPLATRANLDWITERIGRQMDPARDTLIVYLVSHGGEDGALVSGLPGYDWVKPISARWLAGALDHARIRRRIIIVSACFAGSWIPPLANDDTIVIAAAAADKSSFGCSDQRRLTYFGEAFLEGPLGRGASLADSFASAKQTVAAWEKEQKLSPSMPQAYVGRNMRDFWSASAGDSVK